MLGAGIEPAWALAQGILSPSRLPVSPPEQTALVETMVDCDSSQSPYVQDSLSQHASGWFMVEMLVSGAVLFLADHVSKRVVQLRVAGREFRLGPFLSLRPVASRKRVYQTRLVRAGLAGMWLAAFASALVLASAGEFATSKSLVALGAALGGAASNLYDIITDHAVHDFIDLGWWPVFNLADIAILGGLTLAFISR